MGLNRENNKILQFAICFTALQKKTKLMYIKYNTVPLKVNTTPE